MTHNSNTALSVEPAPGQYRPTRQDEESKNQGECFAPCKKESKLTLKYWSPLLSGQIYQLFMKISNFSNFDPSLGQCWARFSEPRKDPELKLRLLNLITYLDHPSEVSARRGAKHSPEARKNFRKSPAARIRPLTTIFYQQYSRLSDSSCKLRLIKNFNFHDF